MTPRPFYRSLTFWSGMLVMMFICWVWWDSFRNYSGAHLGGALSVGSRQGFVEVDRSDEGTPWGGKRVKLAGKMPAKLFPKPALLRGGGDILDDPAEYLRWEEQMRSAPDQVTRARIDMATFPGSHLKLLVPHWLLLLAVLLPWSGFLLWRSRRIRRAIA